MEPSLGTKTPDSKRAHANEYAPISFINSTLVPRVSHIHTLSSQGKLQDQQVGLTQAPETSLLLSLVSACTRACVYPLKVESLFPLVLWSPFSQTHWPSKPSYLGPSPLDATPPPPSLGSLTWAQNSHTYKRTSAIYLFCSLWVTHLGDLGIAYTVSVTLLTMVSSLCLWM